MKAVEIMNELYQEFIMQHPRFADTDFVLPASKVEYLKQMAIVSRQTMALCNAGRNDYHFINLCCPEFSNLLSGEKTVEELLGAMNQNDLLHFIKAWEIGFKHMQKMSTDELMRYALILECRLPDNQMVYRRVIFKYVMVAEDDGKHRGQVLLFIKPLEGVKSEKPSRGIYIVDIQNMKLIHAEKGIKFSEKELKIVSLSKKGFTGKEIADELGIKIQTVNNHRSKISGKLHVQNITFAAAYLQTVGII